MSAHFWAGYISGAAGIIIGNPLDIVKIQLQNGSYGSPGIAAADHGVRRSLTYWIRGASAPILTYGSLNAILYSTYNRCLNVLDPATIGKTDFPQSSLWTLWTAGAAGGLATWLVSTPTELIKCQTQLQVGKSSWMIAREIWRIRGLRGLYQGGAVTSIRETVGYGFFIWSYEVSKRSLVYIEGEDYAAVKVLVAGGIAGVISWASIYPLDVIKTRVQSPDHLNRPEIHTRSRNHHRLSTWSVARTAYRQDGIGVFFRGLGICSIRAFIVNAVQWFVYEQAMRFGRLELD